MPLKEAKMVEEMLKDASTAAEICQVVVRQVTNQADGGFKTEGHLDFGLGNHVKPQLRGKRYRLECDDLASSAASKKKSVHILKENSSSSVVTNTTNTAAASSSSFLGEINVVGKVDLKMDMYPMPTGTNSTAGTTTPATPLHRPRLLIGQNLQQPRSRIPPQAPAQKSVQLGDETGLAAAGGVIMQQDWMKTTRTKKPATQGQRMEREALIDKLFTMFSQKERIMFSEAKRYTNQPESYLREVLNEVAYQNTSGKYRNLWELKSEFKGTSARREEDEE